MGHSVVAKGGAEIVKRAESRINIRTIECDEEWQRQSLFSRCLALKIKGEKEEWSSPGTC